MMLVRSFVKRDGGVFVIAEAGVNHNGDIELAKQLVDAAVEAGRRRWSGDQWYWNRKDSASDVSPLRIVVLPSQV